MVNSRLLRLRKDQQQPLPYPAVMPAVYAMRVSFVVRLLPVALLSSANGFLTTITHRAATAIYDTHLSSIQQATFGMGCFWKPSEALLKYPGVVDTVVGYTGREHDDRGPPTYESVCFSRDYVEGVRVYYDDEQLSYSDVLEAFFEHQEPKPGSRQYGSYIFPHNEEQRQQATDWLQLHSSRVREKDNVPVAWTQVEDPTTFWKAEEYHQQYWQKLRPRIAALVALTAVASGVFDPITPEVYVGNVHSAANALALLGCLYSLAERRIDTKTVKLE